MLSCFDWFKSVNNYTTLMQYSELDMIEQNKFMKNVFRVKVGTKAITCFVGEVSGNYLVL